MIVKTPEPPYYAVIFTFLRTEVGNNDYSLMSKKMIELASVQEGFLGVESAREEIGITVSYWKDLKSIKDWKENFDHKIAQTKGRSTFYRTFKVRISKVERDYGFDSLKD